MDQGNTPDRPPLEERLSTITWKGTTMEEGGDTETVEFRNVKPWHLIIIKYIQEINILSKRYFRNMSGVYNVSRDQINFDEGDSPFFDNINARLDKKKQFGFSVCHIFHVKFGVHKELTFFLLCF